MRGIAIILIAFISGCATIVNDPNIPIAVNFSDGSTGSCIFRNKRGAWETRIPTINVMIRRSDDALNYQCNSDDGRTAIGSIRSEMEGGKMAASVLLWDLGITDAITDKHRNYQRNVVIPLSAKSEESKADAPPAPAAAPSDSVGSTSGATEPKASGDAAKSERAGEE
jgi:hypothetical protein